MIPYLLMEVKIFPVAVKVILKIIQIAQNGHFVPKVRYGSCRGIQGEIEHRLSNDGLND
jgi:hypothetical protein